MNCPAGLSWPEAIERIVSIIAALIAFVVFWWGLLR